MIPTIAASLAVLAPQTKTKTTSWVATPLTPAAVAKRVDDTLATMGKATVRYQYIYDRPYEHPEGGHAQAACIGHIVGPGKFWIQVPNMDFRRRDPINYEIWIADGKRFSSVVDPADPNPRPIAQRPLGPKSPASVWFTDFSRVILSGLGRPTHPLEGFVADARRQGFNVVAQARAFPYKSGVQRDFRIVVFKKAIRYEIIIDARGNMPYSVTNTIGTDQKTLWRDVEWNFRPGKALNAAAVSFRKKAAAPALSPEPRRSSG